MNFSWYLFNLFWHMFVIVAYISLELCAMSLVVTNGGEEIISRESQLYVYLKSQFSKFFSHRGKN